MDSKQQLQEQQQLLAPLNFNFTDAQIALLIELAKQKSNVLLGFNFNEPEKDQLQLRQHSYVKGEFDTYYDLIAYDSTVNAKHAEKVEEMAKEQRFRNGKPLPSDFQIDGESSSQF